MFSIITTVLGFLRGPISDISRDIKETKIALANAKNDEERIKLEDRLGQLEAHRADLEKSQSDPLWRFARFGIAFPFIAYINKVVLWDKVIMGPWSGRTDALSPELFQILMIVLGGYFLYDTVRGLRR